MAVYNLPNYDFSKHGFTMPLNMKRANAFPLDASSVWGSYEDALNYARTDAVAYVGQLVTVVTAPTEEGVKEYKVDVYKIELDRNGDGTLVKVGSSEEIADLTTDLNQLITSVQEAVSKIGTLETKMGTAETDIGTIKDDLDKAEENISSNTTSIENINGEITSIKSDIDTIEENVAANTLALDEYATAKATYALKTEVDTAKTEAIAVAKDETTSQINTMISQYLTGEGAADTIDTLQEIANWIADDEAGAEKIIADIASIKADYLKNSDKTELAEAITNLGNKIGSLPENATSTNVIAYINEVIDALNISDYAKASDLGNLNDKVTLIDETTLPAINVAIASLDTKVQDLEKIDHSHENESLLNSINSDKVNAWDDAATKAHSHIDGMVEVTADMKAQWDEVTKKANNSDLTSLETRVSGVESYINVTLPEIMINKVTQTYTDVNGEQVANRLITPNEAQKLEKLILNADGSVTTGQTVAAGDVQGLADWITNNAPKALEGKIGTSQLTDEIITKLNGAITQITVNGNVLSKDNGNIDIPIATTATHGTVMLGSEFEVPESGAMTIKSININKLTQNANEVLELNGGNASGSFN